jgi:hypothetical protein
VRRSLVLNPTLQLAVAVNVSERGVGRRRLELTDARAVRFVLAASAGDGRRPALDRRLRRQLRAAGVLVSAARIPRHVHLDPRLDLASRPWCGDVLRLTPGCRLHRGPRPPLDIAPTTAGSEPFLPDADVLWARWPGSGIALPYTLAPRLAGAVGDLLSRRRAPAALAPAAAAALVSVGALERDGRRALWSSRVRMWRRELSARGFVVLRDLFSPLFLAAVRAYYDRLEAEGYLLGGDERRRGAPLLYDEPLLGFLAGGLAPIVRRITGSRARATFTYLRVYDPGAILGPHRDRPSCRWNIDLVVGGEPPPDRRTAWPLWLDGRRSPEPIRLGLGDGLLYRGDHVPHWRHPQKRGHTTVLASLHYGQPPAGG